jgi:predicted molibdopterin-dependent oxidoreductase YjgC
MGSREWTTVDLVLTTCPFCSCGCGAYLQATEGKTDGVAASERHPVSLSRLCARGLACHEAPAWGERLASPLVRRDGELQPASWEEALSAAMSGIRAVLGRGATFGVLGSGRATNEENYLAARLARGVLGVPHVDDCLGASYRAVLHGLENVTGWPFGRGTIAEIATCETIILLDGDIATTHPQVAGAVMRALQRGARLVTLSAVATRMARLATSWLRVSPGREREATAALVAATLAVGRLDTGAAAAAAGGIEALRASVAGVAVSEEVRRAASWYALAHAATVIVAPLAGEPGDLEDLGADLATLAVMTGHYDRPGSGVLVLPVRGNQRGALEVGVAPEWLPGCATLDDSEAARRIGTIWGRAPCRDRGLDAAALVASAGGLMVVAEDLPAALPGARSSLDGAAADRFTVVLEAFVTPTVAAASVVLPIASFAENAGTVTNLEGRVQRIRPVVAPPGEARQGWAVLAELCRRLGAVAAYATADDVRHEIGCTAPRYAAVNEIELDMGWGVLLPPAERTSRRPLAGLAPQRPAPERASLVAVADGAFDWGSDPHVRCSPTLCRESVAQRKLYPRGVVGMSKDEMAKLGVRPGWPVRISSATGEVVVPVLLREELGAGMVMVPSACRAALLPVMGTRSVVDVSVARV